MKNIALLLLLFTGIVKAQIVNIPDANFKAKLVSTNCLDTDNDQIADANIDTNSDGEIQVSEAEATNNLIINNANISDLTGIEAFINIEKIRCDHNLLTSINVSNLLSLKELEISFNPITAINTNGLSQLWYLGCSSTPVTALDFRNNPSFTGLDANDCTQLLSLDASGTAGFAFNLFNTSNIQYLNLHGCTAIDAGALQFYMERMGNLMTLDVAGIQGLTMVSFRGNYLDITGCTSIQQLFISGLAANTVDLSSFVNLTDLELKNGNLTSLNLTGLTNLRYLDCENNQLTSLDLSSLINLQQLFCNHNQLSSLNVAVVPQLNQLFCSNNLLSSIDLSNSLNLNVLDCANNQFSNFTVSNLNALEHLYIGNNSINTINVSNNPLLRSLWINDTAINAINLSNNPLLDNFRFDNTAITSMDLSSYTHLTVLEFGSNSLVDLNIKNGKNEYITFINSPNLQFVCADESQIASLQNVVGANTVVSSYCSFVPGGDYNTVTGTVKWDQDNNGCDASDSNFPYNVLMQLSNGTVSGGTFLNANGNYTLYAETGDYTLTPQLEQPSYFNINPTSATFNFPALDNSTHTENFCLTANGYHTDLEIVLVPIGSARPGFDAHYKIIYKNKGNQLLNGEVNLTFDDTRTDFVSASPNVNNQTLNHLLWNFSNLFPFETRVIDLVLNVNSPIETPSVNAGDVLDFTAAISYDISEETIEDNTFVLHQTVRNASDPNDKSCLEGSVIAPNQIGKFVHYSINFENIGTEAASNIVVKDTIDTAKFDINSIQLLYASHPVETKINGNIVEFIFQNIELPPSNINPIGGHGNVLFKIKTLPTLVVGDEIANTANIYFDYNAPVETNEARSAFTTLSTSPFIKDESISIYPNPTKNSIHIQAKNNIQSIQLFDVQGRILQQVLDNKNAATLDISHQANGVYFVKITTDKGSAIEKIIKE